MINELLGQTNFIGRDGFYWWTGQVETQKGSQAKSDDRYRVRIVGQHLKDCNAVAYEDLPWAIVMMPATAPRREGGTNFQSVEYKSGDWVIGFFLDGREGQQPVIMGSVGQQYKASTTHTGKEKPASKCLAFTTFLDPDINLNAAAPATQADAVKSGGVDGTNVPVGTTPGDKPDLNQPPNVSNEAASKLLLGTKCCNSETNPAGEYFCVEVADAKCEGGENDKTKFQNILSELFANVQNNGGQLGTSIVGKYTGKLYEYIDIAQGYANKAIRLASSIVARIKGEIFSFIKQGAKKIIDFMLTQEVIDPEAPGTFVGPYANPSEAVKPAKKRVGRLRGLTAWINNQLKNVNCVMEDLDKRLMEFIEKLIFDALEQVINAASCFIDGLVGDIFSQIAAFLESAISLILGPLQQLLTIIANPLNIIGAALAQIFDMLGITCGTSNNKCSSKEQLNNCTGPCGKEESTNALDDLIDAIENGNLATAGSCSESLRYPSVAATLAIVIGGTTNPTTYTTPQTIVLPPTPGVSPTLNPQVFNPDPVGCTDPTALNYDPSAILDDGTCRYSTTTTPTPVVPPPVPPTPVVPPPTTPGVVTPPIVPPPTTSTPIVGPISPAFVGLVNNSGPSTLTIDNTLIVKLVGGISSSAFISNQRKKISNAPLLISKMIGNAVDVFTEAVETTQELTYALSVDKLVVFEGDSITFTLIANGAKVSDGTIFNYAIFGDITGDDFFDKKTIGTMTMFNNIATKIITIANDTEIENIETATLNVLEALQSVPFSIAASDSPTSTPENPISTELVFTPPVLGQPEVCGDGRVMDIPILVRGDAYLTPPIIVIRGAGFGASAKAELDENGYLKKIRVQRAGIGYAPKRVNQNCVISNFVMLNPGSGYYKDPTVYINGKSNIAKAITDDRGYIGNIEVIDKTKTFACTPQVEIFGGNGLGAKAIAVMECRDDATFNLFQSEVAPSGVDSVIDCP